MAMLNSRDIALLRPDVAQNCRELIRRSAAAGYPVLVTGTVRDEEYQLECVRKGTASKSATKPTFHSVKAGLAFDICKNVRGQEYSDEAFWRGVGAIGKEMGFTWGGAWKSFPDKPHFQWDQGGRYTNKMILAGKYPPVMPLWAAEEDEDMVRYKYLKDVPTAFRPAVEQLMSAGIIQGDGSDKTGNDDVIDLSHDQVRTLLFIYRGGGFDKKLKAAGLQGAVE